MYLVLPFTHSALVGSFRIVIEIGVAAGVIVCQVTHDYPTLRF